MLKCRAVYVFLVQGYCKCRQTGEFRSLKTIVHTMGLKYFNSYKRDFKRFLQNVQKINCMCQNSKTILIRSWELKCISRIFLLHCESVQNSSFVCSGQSKQSKPQPEAISCLQRASREERRESSSINNRLICVLCHNF